MSDSPQNLGRLFEKELAKELGLQIVPGSGNQWHSKLDLKGKLARWSLKYTGAKSFTITQHDVTEAVEATQGISGDGSIPVWAIRLQSPEFDLILLRKNDFLLLQEGEIRIVGDDSPPKKSDIRRARSHVPVLLRDDNG